MKSWIILFSFLAGTALQAAVNIPEFVPNVVDQAKILNSTELKEVNAALLKSRNQSDIWGAVYILPSLNGESIDAVAERAFKKWKLGEVKKDNGLLLVLAIKERKSRFEVGYGLEGDLPDVITLQALDEKLRPRMRKGETAAAIVAAFSFLSEKRNSPSVSTTTPFGGNSTEKKFTVPESQDFLENKENFGLWSWMIYSLTLFLTGPIVYLVLKKKGNAAAEQYPQYKIDINRELLFERFQILSLRAFLLKIFLLINPGVFIYIFASQFNVLIYFVVGFSVLYFWGRMRWKTKGYRSQDGLKSFLNMLKTKSDGLLKKRHIRLKEPGIYEYNDRYFSSPEFRRSTGFGSGSSSSGGSSGSSSSSGGGSSGGGGASSGW